MDNFAQQQLPVPEQIVFFNCLDLYHNSPDSGERQYRL